MNTPEKDDWDTPPTPAERRRLQAENERRADYVLKRLFELANQNEA